KAPVAATASAARPAGAIDKTARQAASATAPAPVAGAATPAPALAASGAEPPAPLPAPASSPAASAAPSRAPAAKAAAVAASAAAPRTSAPATAPAPAAPLLGELPESAKRGLAPLTITGAVYSENPGQRLLLVNGQVLPQGAMAAPEVLIEEIQARSATFNFRGTRFRITF
ncbi:MAG TPA: general secretion pathway protein GspB, partial [Burkholderiaceae bacterium]|nr:general secretion pathway protein GspB [Burkholderiaceae bacterium]